MSSNSSRDKPSRKAVFLDRDGVLNHPVFREETGTKPIAPWCESEFKIYEDAHLSLKRLLDAGFLLLVVSNQPDIRNGRINESFLQKIHQKIREDLGIHDIRYCPHIDVDNCDCRKPSPGMLYQHAKKWSVDLRRSFLIGDTWRDFETGLNAKIPTFIINRSYNIELPLSSKVASLEAAVSRILASAHSEDAR